jgi:hypothetical protein
MKTRDDSSRSRIVSGPEGLDRLRDATRQILAVPKSAIADKMKEPIYARRQRRRRRLPK